MLDIDVKVKSAMPALDNEFNINKAIRILPSKDMEGFFVAKLQKRRTSKQKARPYIIEINYKI